MTRGRVRQHTRKNADGSQSKVKRHDRTGRGAQPRKPLLSPAHAGKTLRRAWRANRRKKQALAGFLGLLALVELLAWLLLQGASLIALTAGILAIAVATLLAGLGGVQR